MPNGLCDRSQIIINSFDDLIKCEKEIVNRIANTENGGNLFMIHPFMLLADIGVYLSDNVREEIIHNEPHLTSLSDSPYNALKESKNCQSIHYHIRGLFKRRSK